jgi:hypothetical protein
MLQYGEVNPLAVFGLRRVDHCPPHFVQVNFDLRTTDKTISDWIYTSTSGRFFIGDRYTENESGSISMSKCAAFEIPGEASYFALQLDQINTYAEFS